MGQEEMFCLHSSLTMFECTTNNSFGTGPCTCINMFASIDQLPHLQVHVIQMLMSSNYTLFVLLLYLQGCKERKAANPHTEGPGSTECLAFRKDNRPLHPSAITSIIIFLLINTTVPQQ